MALLLNTGVFRIGQAIGAHRPRELQCANTVCTSVTSNSVRHLFCSAGSIPGETFAHGSVVAGACGLSLMTFNALVADLALLVPLVRSPCIVARPLACGV